MRSTDLFINIEHHYASLLKERLHWSSPLPCERPASRAGSEPVLLSKRTLMTRIKRIFTDSFIRAYPCHPCNPCSIAASHFAAAPDESNVVHDLLAHLAECMIEMNKDKDAEIKSFLAFLKGEIGAPIEKLSNKTTIQEYYNSEYTFQNIIDVLVKNKKKLKAGYDPRVRQIISIFWSGISLLWAN